MESINFQFLMKIHRKQDYEENGKGLDVIKIRSVFLWHNMHQYQLHGSHTERQLGILTGNRKSKREINSQKVFQLFPVWESRIFSCIRKNRILFTPPLKSGNKQTTTDPIIVIFSLQRFSPHRFFSTQIWNKNGINFDKTAKIVQILYRKTKFLHMTVFSPRI